MLYENWYRVQLEVIPFVTLLDTKRFMILLSDVYIWMTAITCFLLAPGTAPMHRTCAFTHVVDLCVGSVRVCT